MNTLEAAIKQYQDLNSRRVAFAKNISEVSPFINAFGRQIASATSLLAQYGASEVAADQQMAENLKTLSVWESKIPASEMARMQDWFNELLEVEQVPPMWALWAAKVRRHEAIIRVAEMKAWITRIDGEIRAITQSAFHSDAHKEFLTVKLVSSSKDGKRCMVVVLVDLGGGKKKSETVHLVRTPYGWEGRIPLSQKLLGDKPPKMLYNI